MLEIWDIEQDASLPIMRISVCPTDPEKDFIKQTFSEAYPKYLNLYEQILIVNTSCVDGSIVFIDPISFSIIKRIQLKYSDYELSR